LKARYSPSAMLQTPSFHHKSTCSRYSSGLRSSAWAQVSWLAGALGVQLSTWLGLPPRRPRRGLLIIAVLSPDSQSFPDHAFIVSALAPPNALQMRSRTLEPHKETKSGFQCSLEGHHAVSLRLRRANVPTLSSGVTVVSLHRCTCPRRPPWGDIDAHRAPKAGGHMPPHPRNSAQLQPPGLHSG
jgi:hypothetical protein